MAVKDGLPATDFSRMNREWVKAVAEAAAGGGGGGGGDSDFAVAVITVKYNVPEGFSIIGVENERIYFLYDGTKLEGNDAKYQTHMEANDNDGVYSFNIVLYKNRAYFDVPFPIYEIEGYDLYTDEESIVCTGGIAYDDDLGVYVITGDGTYTATLSLNRINNSTTERR